MRMVLGAVLITLATTLYGQKAEAENGFLEGTRVESSRAGFSGSGYITGFEQDGDAVTMSLNVDESRVYELTFGYAAPFGYKENDIYVNDIYAGAQQFEESPEFTETSFGNIFLTKGENQVKVVKTWGYFELDYVSAIPAQRNEYNYISENLINENATEEARVLYQYLKDHYGHRIISGQQAGSGGEVELNYIKEKTGKIPAIKGFDLMDYSPSRVERGTSSNESGKAIEWWNRGGIVSLMWHWNAPKDFIDSQDQTWWSGFYTIATTFDLSIAMNDLESEEYELIIRDIDVIAEELALIAASGAPVLWRPLHEAEGGWFWWGAKGPEACVWLWQLIYDRITNHHKINNLIWVWTGTSTEEALEWYPGDEYVDIIGADIYLENGNYSTSFTMFDKMAGIHDGQKLITMSETGTIPDPTDLNEQKARWSWFCVWSGDFILNGVRNDVNHVNEVYNHEYVITFDELPDFSDYISPDFLEDNGEVLGLADGFLLEAYPNPVTDYMTISNAGPGSFLHGLIYDIKGNLLRQIAAAEFSVDNRVDFRNFPSGLYIIKLTTKTGSVTIKVKKR